MHTYFCFSQFPLAGMLKPGAVTVVKGTRFANLYATGLHLVGTCSSRDSLDLLGPSRSQRLQDPQDGEQNLMDCLAHVVACFRL